MRKQRTGGEKAEIKDEEIREHKSERGDGERKSATGECKEGDEGNFRREGGRNDASGEKRQCRVEKRGRGEERKEEACRGEG